MTDKKKKINTGGRGLFKGVIGYTYQYMVSESVRVPATKMASERGCIKSIFDQIFFGKDPIPTLPQQWGRA